MPSQTFRILAINPAKTSTKIGVYDNERSIFEKTLTYVQDNEEEWSSNIRVQEQLRKEGILHSLDEEGLNVSNLDAVVGRGGLLKPLVGGTYLVNEEMIHDLRVGISGRHPSNLGGILAFEIANQLNIPAYIVDPVVVDELEPVARLSGIPLLERRSIFHALSQKAVARRIAIRLRKPYDSLNLIVAHMGRGITIGLHQNGRVVDVNNGLHGEGPFSLDRAGTLPVGDLVSMCFSGQFKKEEMMDWLVSNGGLKGYLGTTNLEKIEHQVRLGDPKAKIVYEAMAYQISKEIGALSTIVHGEVDGIILTGGLAYGSYLVQSIMDKVSWVSDVFVEPGEDELKALVEGTLRVLKREEKVKSYPNPPDRPTPDERTLVPPIKLLF